MPWYSYSCKDYPGMENCVGKFQAETDTELLQHIELHARLAHDENSQAWSPDDRAQLKGLMKFSAG